VGYLPDDSQIDEFALYDTPLSAAQVTAHYNAARTAVPYKLTKITLPSGRVWAQNVYDAATERIKTHTDQHGGTWQVDVPVFNRETGMSVVTVTDPHNGKLLYEHDALRGYRLVSETDQLGKKSVTEYDEGGFPYLETDRNGEFSYLAHDKRGNRIFEARCGSEGSGFFPCTMEYNSYYLNTANEFDARNDQLVVSRDGRSASETDDTYDEAGNLTIRRTGDGAQETVYVHDAADRLTSETFDPRGLARRTAYVYDANDNVVKETSTAAGTTRSEVTEFAYNADDLLTRRTVKNGAQDIVTSWTVDNRGLVVAMTEPRGNVAGANATDFTTAYRYDTAEQLIEVKAPQVKVEKTEAVADARPTLRYGYDSAGRRTHAVDAEGRTTTKAFDRLGRVTSVTGAAYTPPGGSTLSPKTSYAYDAAGRVIRYTDARGSVWNTEYDALDNRVRVTEPGPNGQPGGQWTYEYDTAGELLASVNPLGARTQATYDGLGRQITATIVERKPTLKTLITRMEYDKSGNKIKETSPGGRVVSYRVNPAGEITAETDPLNDVTRYEYDLAGRTVKVTDPLGNATVIEYDLAGRETAVKDLNASGAVQRTFGTGYDVAGNPVTETSGEGRVVRRSYDATGAVVELVEPVTANDSITTTFGYDANGEMTRSTDGRGNTVWTAYNSLGLPESVIEPVTQAHPAAADRTWTTAYDAAGNTTAVVQPGGVRVDREYDHLGRLTKETGTGAQVATPTRVYGYDLAGRDTAIGDYNLEYDDRGLLTKVSKGAAQVAAFAYDDMGNVTQRADPSGTATFGWDTDDRLRTASEPVTGRSFTYGYDNADRLTSLTSATPRTTQTFGYDAMDRVTSHSLQNSAGTEIAKITYGWNRDDSLVSKTTTGTAGAGANTYGYDHAGRMTSWEAPNGNVTTYEWDASGNRTRAGSETFAYDQRNRVTTGGGTDYTYTPRGTLATETTGGVTRNLTFDAFDRLVADGDATYAYDGLGRLASRTQGGQVENFAYSGLENDVVAVTDETGAVQARYGRDPYGGLLGLKEGSAAAIGVMTDQHGDLVGTFSGTALVDSTAYDPYGEVTARTGTASRLGYQGEYTDPVTGKVNMHARWYIPGTGGFASRDDVALSPYPSINLNRYTYAMGDPMSLDDPTGNCPFCIPLLFHAARIAAQIIARQIAQRIAAEAAKRVAAEAAKRLAAEAAKRFAKQAAKKVAKETAKKAAKQGTKQGVKKAAKQGAKKAARQGIKKGVKQAVKKGIKQARKQADKRVTKQTAKKAAKKVAKKTAKSTKKAVKKTAKKVAKTVKKAAKKAKPKGKSTKARQQQKNEIATEISSDAGDIGSAEPVDLGIEFCGSFRSCVKDAVEDLVENTVEDLVDDLIDEVAPDLPVDLPGSGGSCDRGRKPNSFVPGTRVLMADGSTRAIEDIRVGDQVAATDPASGVTGARPVTTLITGDGVKDLVGVTIDVDGSRGDAVDVVTATDEHPFWVPSLREWVNAGDLKPGMWLRTSAGTHVQITALKKWTTTQRVHNLTVDDLHTYHVVAGDQAILVHNAGPGRGLGDDEIYLWRAVQDPELAGIHGNRSYHNPLGYETKYFAFTEEGAREYGRRAYGVRPQEGPYTVTRTTIQKGKIPPSSIMPPTADVPGGGVALPTDLLDDLGRPRIMPQSSC